MDYNQKVLQFLCLLPSVILIQYWLLLPFLAADGTVSLFSNSSRIKIVKEKVLQEEKLFNHFWADVVF